MYTSVQQKVEMCAVAQAVARKRKKLSPAAAAQEAAVELGLAEDDEDIAFAEAQLQALAEVCPPNSSSLPPSMEAIELLAVAKAACLKTGSSQLC